MEFKYLPHAKWTSLSEEKNEFTGCPLKYIDFICMTLLIVQSNNLNIEKVESTSKMIELISGNS